MSLLFSPLQVGPTRLANRIVVAPMCQYSADDGSATDWHLQHLMTLAMSGAALVVMEATAVERRGRISPRDLGLYSDANERALVRVLDAARTVAAPDTRFGIQLAHAGRKASVPVPWERVGNEAVAADPWPTIAPSALAYADGWQVPAAMTEADVAALIEAFVTAARRARRIGFDEVEIHVAHGYLLHEFLSPLSNLRTDRWGGDRGGRMALPLAVARAVREAVPDLMVGCRISGTDWVDGGWQIADSIAFAAEIRDIGLDFICVSSGGNVNVPIDAVPGYQVPLARAVRRAVPGLPVRAVGMIAAPAQAEAILAAGDADMIALARAMLDDPRWPWHAAEQLDAEVAPPPQYQRAARKLWAGAELARPAASGRAAAE
jgi:2,4-dienoyl-CoA reductase-like NADH-dependent reductase (Old Yellow Enzyme family)